MKYEIVAGGYRKFEYTSMVSCRRFLDEAPDIKDEMFRRNRIAILDGLAATGWPFGATMQNIKAWREKEYQRGDDPLDNYWGLPKNDRPVYFLTTVYVGPFEYLKEMKGEPVADDDQGSHGGEAGGVGGGPGVGA